MNKYYIFQEVPIIKWMYHNILIFLNFIYKDFEYAYHALFILTNQVYHKFHFYY